jgi:hypothetical protein
MPGRSGRQALAFYVCGLSGDIGTDGERPGLTGLPWAGRRKE